MTNLHQHVADEETNMLSALFCPIRQWRTTITYIETVVLNSVPVMPKSSSKLLSRAWAIAFRST